MRLGALVFGLVLASTFAAASADARPPDERFERFEVRRIQPRASVESTARSEWRAAPERRESSASESVRTEVAASRSTRQELLGPIQQRHCARYVKDPSSSKRRCEVYEAP